MLKHLLLLLLFISLQAQALTFRQAKDELKELYKAYPESFYCKCDIDWKKIDGKTKLVPDLKSCEYKVRKEKQRFRAERVEFEHKVPAWEFGHQLQCWQAGKRKNCIKTSKEFNVMYGDVHNLVPSVGEVNADRSNYRFGMIDGEKRVYGACDAEVNFKQRVFEPAPSVRGDIARVYFYFEDRYGLKISKKQKKLFKAWDKADPVDLQECEIHEAKSKIQGNGNVFVWSKCAKLDSSKFSPFKKAIKGEWTN